ncbi:MAG: hypothetical protein Q6J18_00835 [Gloeomargarita sp. DG02_3_bins_56]
MGSDANEKLNRRIQREIRTGRRFSLADVIAQEGADFLKGASPVPPLVQARTAVNLWIKNHLTDPEGALKAVLQRWVHRDETHMSQHFDHPLNALRELLETLLAHPSLLEELVREADCEWGRMYGETPYFEKTGPKPHPDDPYTHTSVRRQLTQLLLTLRAP